MFNELPNKTTKRLSVTKDFEFKTIVKEMNTGTGTRYQFFIGIPSLFIFLIETLNSDFLCVPN